MVVVALGEPGVPVVCICALAEDAVATTTAASIAPRNICLADFIVFIWFLIAHLTHLDERNLSRSPRSAYKTLGQSYR
jgi:hypothetical protein